MSSPQSLGGLPVVLCTLHSQVAPVCAALAGLRVAYVQVAGGALPVSLSDTVRVLKEARARRGRARGRAVPRRRRRLRHVRRRARVAGEGAATTWSSARSGPGIVGTGSRARPRRARARRRRQCRGRARRSARPRRAHLRGRPARAPPRRLAPRAGGARPLPRRGRRARPRRTATGWEEACAGLPLSHMGRGAEDDPAFFRAAFAAGVVARGHTRLMKVWEGKRFAVLVEDEFEIADTPDAVAIVAVDADERVVLVRQHRRAVGTDLLELPAGLVDEGEEPLAAAQRELREETGAARWQLARARRDLDLAGLRQRARHPVRRGRARGGRARTGRGRGARGRPLDAARGRGAGVGAAGRHHPRRAFSSTCANLPKRYRCAAHAHRRRQGDQAPGVPRRADARRGRASSSSAATRSSSRPAPEPGASSPTPTTRRTAPGSRRSTRSGRARSCC